MDDRGVLLVLDDPIVDLGLSSGTSSEIIVEDGDVALEGDFEGVSLESGRRLRDVAGIRRGGVEVEAELAREEVE